MGVTLISPTASHGGLNWDTNLETNLGRLADGINLAANLGTADLNAILTSGIYYGSIANLTNAPVSGGTSTLVLQVISSNVTAGSGHVVQRAARTVDGATWQRSYAPGYGWTAWTQIGGDTGWAFGSNFSLASGWSTLVDPNGVGSGSSLAGGIRLVGKQLELRFRVNRTGSTLTADSSGNLADTLVCTINTAAYQPASPIYDNFYVIGVRQGTVRLGTDGTVAITDMVPNGTISTGDTVQVGIRGFID